MKQGREEWQCSALLLWSRPPMACSRACAPWLRHKFYSRGLKALIPISFRGMLEVSEAAAILGIWDHSFGKYNEAPTGPG